MNLYKDFTLDFARLSAGEVIRIHEGDKNSVTFRIAIYNNGAVFDLTGYTIKYDATVANYLAEQDATGSASGNIASIPITPNMTAVSGKLKIDVKIIDGTDILFTQTVKAFVDRAVINGDTIIDISGTTIAGKFADIDTDIAALEARFPIQTADIAPGAVKTNQLGAGAVTTGKIEDNAVTSEKLSSDVQSALAAIVNKQGKIWFEQPVGKISSASSVPKHDDAEQTPYSQGDVFFYGNMISVYYGIMFEQGLGYFCTYSAFVTPSVTFSTSDPPTSESNSYFSPSVAQIWFKGRSTATNTRKIDKMFVRTYWNKSQDAYYYTWAEIPLSIYSKAEIDTLLSSVAGLCTESVPRNSDHDAPNYTSTEFADLPNGQMFFCYLGDQGNEVKTFWIKNSSASASRFALYEEISGKMDRGLSVASDDTSDIPMGNVFEYNGDYYIKSSTATPIGAQYKISRGQ